MSMALLATTGCDRSEDNLRKAQISKGMSLMNSVEQGIYSAYLKDRLAFSSDYYPMLRGMMILRKIRRKESEPPFCDVQMQLLVSENSIRQRSRKPNLDKVSISAQFFNIFGKSLKKSCLKIGETSQTVAEIPAKVEVVENVEVVSLDGEEVISAALYDELIGSVGKCRRAGNRVMELTDGNRLLTKGDYTEINRIILNCKNSELNSTVNFK